MDYRVLGRTGVKVAPLCLGTANFGRPTGEREAERMIMAALDGGINMIDTSNSYAGGESERIIGQTLARVGRRHEVVLASKSYFPTGPGPNDRGNSRLHIMRSCEESLRRLQVDYLDLYQLHRPSEYIPIDETLSALTDLVRQGKVRYIGCSTFPAWKVMEALMVSELKGYVRFISEQPPYNLLDRRIENELVPMCQEHGLGLLPWSPLAMGLLAGRYHDAAAFPDDSRAALLGGIFAERITAAGIEVGRRFTELAAQLEISAAQLAILWVKDQPGVTAPIIGPRTHEQLTQLLPVLEMTLSPEVRDACDALVAPGSAVVDFHNTAWWMKMQI